MDGLAKKLNIANYEGWYSVQRKTFLENGGSGLLEKYNGSKSKLLQSIYSEYQHIFKNTTYILWYKWDVMKFDTLPHGYFNSLSNQRVFMDELTKELKITNISELYSVTRQQLIQHGAAGLLSKYQHSPKRLLKTIYPEYLEKKTRQKMITAVVSSTYWAGF